jgi:hypothetical protein
MPVHMDPRDYTAGIPAKERKVTDIKIKYRYPRKLNLRPGSDLHEQLRQALLSRALRSHEEMAKRHPAWQKMDQMLTAYVPPDEKEQALQDADSRKPISIVVPVCFATLDVLMTYMVAAYLDGPVFNYEGVGPEDIQGTTALQTVVDYQTRKAKMAVQLHTMFRDTFVYGFGVTAPTWEVDYAFKTRDKADNINTMMGLFKKGVTRSTERVISYEGNKLVNIDPYRYLPDTNVPIQDVQRGEFVGWVRRESYTELLRREESDRGETFNVKYIEEATSGTSFLANDDSDRNKDGVGDPSGTVGGTFSNPVDVLYMYVDIVPSDYKIGTADYPEKWLFAIAADQVIISASPVNADHNMFPVAVAAPDFDGYSVSPISRLEMVYGLQHLVNFLFNSHVANVRKAVNDMFVVDPEMVNINDMKKPSAGKLIRLRRQAWGRGVQNAVQQLDVNDITRSNVPEALTILGLSDQFSGSVDSLKGLLHGGERRSATEFNAVFGSALSRLERLARMTGIQAFTDLGYMLASHTQQNMSQERYYRILGDSVKGAENKRQLITPEDLNIDYDVFVNDGTIPNSGDPQTWTQIFQAVAGDEELRQDFDITAIFTHLAKISGAKNIGQFVNNREANATTLPDEEIADQVQRGNLVPIGGVNA